MSLSSERGKLFERKIQKITAKILRLDVKRDSRSGAGELHKMDIRDRFNEIPLFIECKDQAKANIKADWRKANGQASFGQAPIVVFPDNEEVLCTMRYSDLLQLVREGMDWRESTDKLLKESGLQVDIDKSFESHDLEFSAPKSAETPVETAHKTIGKKIHKELKKQHIKTCRAGHIADQWGYCMAKKCPYSRGYKKPKEKKK